MTGRTGNWCVWEVRQIRAKEYNAASCHWLFKLHRECLMEEAAGIVMFSQRIEHDSFSHVRLSKMQMQWLPGVSRAGEGAERPVAGLCIIEMRAGHALGGRGGIWGTCFTPDRNAACRTLWLTVCWGPQGQGSL